jgi:hypothetical protein
MPDVHKKMEEITSGQWIEIIPPKPGEVFVPPPGYKAFTPQRDPEDPSEPEAPSADS